MKRFISVPFGSTNVDISVPYRSGYADEVQAASVSDNKIQSVTVSYEDTEFGDMPTLVDI